MRQSQSIRSGTVENKKRLAIGLENFPHEIAGAPSPAIVAIGSRCVPICFFESGPCFRTDWSRVVARKYMALARVHQPFRTRDLSWKQLPLRLTIDATTAPDKQRLAESDPRPSRQDAFARQLTFTLLLAAPAQQKNE